MFKMDIGPTHLYMARNTLWLHALNVAARLVLGNSLDRRVLHLAIMQVANQRVVDRVLPGR